MSDWRFKAWLLVPPMAFGQILSTDIVYDSGNALSPLIDIGQVCLCEYATGRIVFALLSSLLLVCGGCGGTSAKQCGRNDSFFRYGLAW